MVCIRLRTSNDGNGNPRRLYLILHNDGSIESAVDEGYRGRGALAGYHVNEGEAPIDLDTTPAEYRRLLRDFGE